jgi:hypothetical protein
LDAGPGAEKGDRRHYGDREDATHDEFEPRVASNAPPVRDEL